MPVYEQDSNGLMLEANSPSFQRESARVMPEGYEVVDHTADWALRVRGANMSELLRNAAVGMNSLLVSDISVVPRNQVRVLRMEADDAETLLVDWLSELAYFAEDESLLFSEFDITASSTHLDAIIRGGRVSALNKHIKAVTYHELQVKETRRGLEATIVFDV